MSLDGVEKFHLRVRAVSQRDVTMSEWRIGSARRVSSRLVARAVARGGRACAARSTRPPGPGPLDEEDPRKNEHHVSGDRDGPSAPDPAANWHSSSPGLLERARQDSNLRPSAPEADALSTELQARGPRCYPSNVGRASASGFTLNRRRSSTLGRTTDGSAQRKTHVSLKFAADAVGGRVPGCLRP